jgi:hypothetical protein
MPINLLSPSCQPGSVVIYSPGVAGFSPDSIGSLTKVNGIPVNALLELNGTDGLFLSSRLTTAQFGALTTTCDGMIGFNSTTLSFVGYANNTSGNFLMSTGGSVTGLNSITLGTPSTTVGSILLKNATNNNTTTIKSGVAAANFTLTLPTSLPLVAGTPLVSDTAGNLSFVPANGLTVAVPITAAQIKTMYDTPIAIIASPGAGFAILVHSWSINVIGTGLVQYAAGAAISLQYANTAHGGGLASSNTMPATAITTANNTNTFESAIPSALAVGLTTAIANLGIFLSCITQDFTTGTGTAIVNVSYSVVSVT